MKSFLQFINEESSSVNSFKKDFFKKLEEKLTSDNLGATLGYVDVDPDQNSVEITFYDSIEDEKEYAILDVSRPNFSLEFTYNLKFEFNDDAIESYLSKDVVSDAAADFGLINDVYYSDTFNLSYKESLSVTVDEFPDFGITDELDDFVEIEWGKVDEEEFLNELVDELSDLLSTTTRTTTDAILRKIEEYENGG
jgi:hypothetical protein